MEVVGLVVGIAGLAGLFSTCLDVVSRYDSFKEFKAESQAVKIMFNAQKLRLRDWGHAVGFRGDRLMDKHSEFLDDQEIRSACWDLLSLIKAICSRKDDSIASLVSVISRQQSLRKLMRSKRGRHGQESYRDRLNWAFGNKAKKQFQLSQLCQIVDVLYHLVPPNAKASLVASGGRMSDFERDVEKAIKRELHEWLLGPNFQNELYEISFEKRTPGTCEWVLQRQWFLDWSSSDFPNQRAKILWISGPAGFGKSILCARITEHLLKDSTVPIAHFFYSSGSDSGRNPFAAMRSWISQIMSYERVFALTRERESKSHGKGSTRQDIENIWRDIVTEIPGCTFIIDGLDECHSASDCRRVDDGYSITNFLEKIKSTIEGTQTRILIVSRDEPEIRNTLYSAENQGSAIYRHDLKADDVRSDNEKYSRDIVNSKLSTRPDDFKEEIALELASRCNGQFLWAKLQEDYLSKGKSNAKIRQYINSTPTGLEHAYKRNWERISEKHNDDQDRAILILRWVAFALEPLTVTELTGALLISDDCKKVRLDDLPDEINEEYVATEILDLCGSLIEIHTPQAGCDVSLRTVHLAHFSVKENLLSVLPSHKRTLRLYPGLEVSTGVLENTLLAKMCLSYVDCEEVWVEDMDEGKRGNVLHAFRKHATAAWPAYSNRGNKEDDQFIDLVKHLFVMENPNWISWKTLYDQTSKVILANYLEESYVSTTTSTYPDPSEDLANGDSTEPTESSAEAERIFGKPADHPLWYAAWIDVPAIVDSLIITNKDRVNEEGILKHTVLGAACVRGNLQTVQVLLDNHAEVNCRNVDGFSPLHSASTNNYHNVAKLLLAKGANVDARNDVMGTPLHCAVIGRHINTVQLLLDHNADIEARGIHGFTATCVAVANGNVDLVKMLIAKGANMTTAIDDGALTAACRSGFLEIVRIFLEVDVDLDAFTSNDEHTPLTAASCNGHLEVAKLLIEKGADIEARSKGMETPLYCAATNGHLETTQLLLDHNADVNVPNAGGWTPVNSAAKEGHTEIVKMLVFKRANILTANEYGPGMVPFYTACHWGFLEIVRVLFDVGVDINICTQEHQWVPLVAASNYGHLEVVKFLIEKGANVQAQSKGMETPLHRAATNGHLETTQLLLDHNADVNVPNSGGWTPVNSAARAGHTEIVRKLVSKGANVSTASGSGIAPFYNACHGGFIEIVRLLYDVGVEINICTQEDQWTPLIAASNNGHLEVVKFLLEMGADVDARDDEMTTPLCCAALNGHIDIIQLLFDRNADIDSRDINDWTPLHAAAAEGHIEVVKFLIEKGADYTSSNNYSSTPILSASENGHFGVVNLLLDQKPLPNLKEQDVDGLTPLNAAVNANQPDIVKILLGKGADVTLEIATYQDASTIRENSTPVLNASSIGNAEIVRLLLRQGANANVQGHKKMTPLQAACANGHLEVAKLLVKYGAELNIVHEGGASALSFASYYGHTKTLRWLLEVGAEVNYVHEAKSTPLFEACLGGHRENVELLLRYDADRNIAPGPHVSPLYIASLSGFTEIAALLLGDNVDDATPDLEAADGYGRTSLFVSAANGHTDVVKLLHAKGASVKIQDKYGGTPLWAAVKNGQTDAAKYLVSIPGTWHALEYGVWDRDILWWALGSGSAETVTLVRGLIQPAENLEADTEERCKVARFDAELSGCTVCTRCLLDGEMYQYCTQCDDFSICAQCVSFGVQCVDAAHTWGEKMPESDELAN